MLPKRVCSGLRAFKFSHFQEILKKIGLLRSYSTTQAQVNSNAPLNPSLLNKINSLLTNKKTRDKNGKTILKNTSLIKQAFETGIQISDIVYRRETLMKGFSLNVLKDVTLHHVSQFPAELQMEFEDRKDGMIAICDIPSTDINPQVQRSCFLPVTIIVDNIRNYENMGIIISLFEHLRCRKLLLTKGCVDIWNPKTIECSMGSVFGCHWNIMNNLSWDDVRGQLMKDSKILLADACKGEEINSKLPPVRYTDVKYKSYQELALIIGGETEGVSEEARTFCSQNMGQEIYIPIEDGVDSLNGGMATGIILSEITRQLQID